MKKINLKWQTSKNGNQYARYDNYTLIAYKEHNTGRFGGQLMHKQVLTTTDSNTGKDIDHLDKQILRHVRQKPTLESVKADLGKYLKQIVDKGNKLHNTEQIPWSKKTKKETVLVKKQTRTPLRRPNINNSKNINSHIKWKYSKNSNIYTHHLDFMITIIESKYESNMYVALISDNKIDEKVATIKDIDIEKVKDLSIAYIENRPDYKRRLNEDENDKVNFLQQSKGYKNDQVYKSVKTNAMRKDPTPHCKSFKLVDGHLEPLKETL